MEMTHFFHLTPKSTGVFQQRMAGGEGVCRGKPAWLHAKEMSGAGEGLPHGAHQPARLAFCYEGLLL